MRASGATAERIRKGLRGAQVTEAVIQPEKAVAKLLIRVGGVQTKIEVTPVLRGCAYEPEGNWSTPHASSHIST